jgi:hypothetical protein
MNPSVETDTRTDPLKRKRAGSESGEVCRLAFCDAWRRTFSTAEGLRALLSPEGCFMSDLCGIHYETSTREYERCRICWYLDIDYRYKGVKANFTRTEGFGIDNTTSNEPLRNIRLKSISILTQGFSQNVHDHYRTYGLLTPKGI